MTPVVYVKSSGDEEESFDPMTILGGVLLLFFMVYVGFVLYRRFYLGIGWCESFSSSPRNPRVDKANREHRKNKTNSDPKKPTIVRFKINGVVLEDET